MANDNDEDDDDDEDDTEIDEDDQIYKIDPKRSSQRRDDFYIFPS